MVRDIERRNKILVVVGGYFGKGHVMIASSATQIGRGFLVLLEALFTGVAHLDALAPFRVQHLVSTDTPGWVRVEDAVDDVAATGLGEC